VSGSRDFPASLGSFRTEVKQDETGLWHATSPDLQGFFVTKSTLPELRRHIPDALYSMLVTTQGELATAIRERDAIKEQLENVKANEGMCEHYADKAIQTLRRLLKITPHTHDCPGDETCPVVDARRTVEAYRR
jgi:hypothetical protein